MLTKQRGQSISLVITILFSVITICLLINYVSCDTKHKATIYKLKNHHIVMKDDDGKWWEYVLKNLDIDFDIQIDSGGEMKLPPGGSWRPATYQEEEEVEAETEATESTTVEETDAGAPDGAGDVGGDSGGSDGGGGGDGGGGDGGSD